MTTVQPDLEVATKIGASTLAFGSTAIALNANCFPGPPRVAGGPIPEACVFVLEVGSDAPMDVFRLATPTGRPSRVQVWVRGPIGDYDGARTTARAIWAALHKSTISGCISVRCAQAEPVYLGTDDKRHHEFSINVLVLHGLGA